MWLFVRFYKRVIQTERYAMTRVILSTFAGRFDRMGMLLEYAKRALDKGYISEFHIWDFCRNSVDRDILDERYPIGYTQAGDEYRGNMKATMFETPFGVKTNGNVWFEIGTSCLKLCDKGLFLYDAHSNLIAPLSENIRVEYGYQHNEDIAFQYMDGLLHVIQGENSISVSDIQLPNRIRIKSDTDTLWDFHSPFSVFKPDRTSMNRHFTPYYYHYHTFAQLYSDTILIKADDDIVFFDVERLPHFVDVCRNTPSAFMASANVINNAYKLYPGDFAETAGFVHDPDTMTYTELYFKGTNAENLHKLFLAGNHKVFEEQGNHTLKHQQISINMIALRSDVFPFFSHVLKEEAYNDECCLSTHIPKLYNMDSCVVVKDFVAAHLSFYTQDGSMNTHQLISEYSRLLQ